MLVVLVLNAALYFQRIQTVFLNLTTCFLTAAKHVKFALGAADTLNDFTNIRRVLKTLEKANKLYILDLSQGVSCLTYKGEAREGAF